MDIKLGFSTGVLYKTHSTYETLGFFKAVGVDKVELGFVKTLDDAWMQNVKTSDLEHFSYVSMHAPKFEYANDEASKNTLDKIRAFHQNIRALDMVVFHPDPVIDFSVLAGVGFPVGIENMDNRKLTHRSAQELLDIITKFPEFNVVLDVNHIYSNDQSLNSAKDYYDLLGDKIAQIHLSGYAGYHEPIYQTKQVEIFKAIQNFEAPIIVESVMNPDQLILENEYILNLAKNT